MEGESYEVVDGKKQLTDYALTVAEDGYLMLHHYAIGHTSFPKYDGETVVLATYPEEQLTAEQTWADASAALNYPRAVSLSAEDQAFCDGVMDDVRTYQTEMELKFITGEEPLSSYDAFVAQLERMGVGKAVEIYRKAYEEYMAR